MATASKTDSDLTTEPFGKLADDEGPHSDLEQAFDALRKKKVHFDRLFDYYDGDAPIVYATDMLAQYFRNLSARFTENWCAPVIDSVLERLVLTGFNVKDPAAKKVLLGLAEGGELELESYDAHTAALVTGEAFIIVWPEPNEAGVEEVQIYHNDPRLCVMFYQQDNPKIRRFGAKWFMDSGTGFTYITLYYADRLECYRTISPKHPDKPGDFAPVPDDDPLGLKAVEEHDKGTIPMFHLRRNRRRTIGELDGKVISGQDMINKLLADMMVAAEFSAFPQRYAVTNADLSNLKAFPGSMWTIPPGADEEQSSSVGQFAATQLNNYMDARTQLAEGIATVTRTPKYYMTGATQVSGEALMAMETPLVKKVEHYEQIFGATWREIAAFYCKLSGVEILPAVISCQWDVAGTQQPETESTARLNNTRSGMPLPTVLREQGWDAQMLLQLAEDIKAEQASKGPSLGELQLQGALQRANGIGTPTPAPAGATPPPQGAQGQQGDQPPKTPPLP